jgi:hypothetical protein
MKRQTTGTEIELATEGSGGGGGGTVDQGTGGVSPWLVQIDASQLPLPVDANVPAGLATEAKQDDQIVQLAAIETAVESIDTKLTNPLPVSGPLTDAELRATPVPVSQSSQPLPTGAATAANQATGNTSLASIDSKLTNPLPVSLASAPLPTGAATAANQATEISSLASIKTNTDPLVVSGAGGYVRQDSTGTIAKETGGNLATVKTNTDPLVTSGGGGYVRQDSNATIAKETGGNLATVKTNTDVLGVSTGSKVITDADGTLQQYLRGLVYLLITPLAALVTIARKFVYGSATTLTTTNWSNLASGSGWQSASISTGGASEIQFRLTTKGAAGSTGLADFYLAESFSSGNFTDGAGTSEATFTAANRKNSRWIGAVQLNTTNSVTALLKYTDVSGSLPERVVLIGINNSGGTISSTGGDTVFDYELIN